MADKKLQIRILAKDEASRTMSKVGGALKALGAVAAAVGVIQIGRSFARGLRDATVAAGRFQAEVIRLDQALKNAGLGTRANSDAIREYADELQRTSLFSETAAIRAQALAINMGASTKTAQEAALAAANLSAATGVDLDTAVRQVNRTLGGYQGELAELVPQIKTLTAEQLKAGDAARLLNDLFKDAAKTVNDSFEGAVVNLNTELDKFKRAVGGPIRDVLEQFLTKVINPLVQNLTKFVQNSPSFANAFKQVALGLVSIAESVAAVVIALENLDKVAPSLFEGLKKSLGSGTLDQFSLATHAAGAFAESVMEAGDAGDQLGLNLLKSLGELRESLNALDLTADVGLFDREEAQGFAEDVTVITGRLIEAGEAVNQGISIGFDALNAKLATTNDELESVGSTMSRALRGQGVGAANAIGSALVQAATQGKFAFKAFFRQLMIDLLQAIIRALILRAILAVVSFGGTEASAAFAGQGALTGSGGALTGRAPNAPAPTLSPLGIEAGVGSPSGLNLVINLNGTLIGDRTPTKVLRTIAEEVATGIRSGAIRRDVFVRA